ncbi:MAG: hypothetical protein ABEH86_12035 [Haloarcula sp.]
MTETGHSQDDSEYDWSVRHARTNPAETRRLVTVPDEAVEDWDLRHAETKDRS